MHGVGRILSKKARAATLDYEQIDGRLMTLDLQNSGNPIQIICAYAPQSCNKTKEKDDFYEKLRKKL